MLKRFFNSLSSNYRILLFHVLLWTLFISSPFAISNGDHFNGGYIYLCKSLLLIALFYTNYFLLVPAFLLKRKTLLYIIIIVAIILGIGYLITVVEPRPMPRFMDFPDKGEMEMMKKMEDNIRFKMFPNTIVVTLHLLISAILRIYLEWDDSKKRQLASETEKKTSELNFLKAQLNPHFFFNSLNTIFSLAIKKSDKTPVAILNLSELMRYMLYETNKDEVKLEAEIAYIENYIELQKLRLPSNNTIVFEVHGNPKNIHLPPLLFISFIENAFKYGVNPAKQNEIVVRFDIDNNAVKLMVINDIYIELRKENASGLGIDNTQKRINLYFPNRNSLNLYEKDHKFHVELKLDLNEN